MFVELDVDANVRRSHDFRCELLDRFHRARGPLLELPRGGVATGPTTRFAKATYVPWTCL